MDTEDIKIGMKVHFEGTVIKYFNNTFKPGAVRVRSDETGEEAYIATNLITPISNYDPTRKFRKGDLVKITGYHGRFFGSGLSTELNDFASIGSLVYLEGDEIEGDVILPDGILAGHYYHLSVACIELVKPIEEIEKEEPYLAEADMVKYRSTGEVVASFCPVTLGQEKACEMAKQFCNELNQKPQENK